MTAVLLAAAGLVTAYALVLSFGGEMQLGLCQNPCPYAAALAGPFSAPAIISTVWLIGTIVSIVVLVLPPRAWWIAALTLVLVSAGTGTLWVLTSRATFGLN
ncbi:MAG: hypothetical protein M3N46_12140 [Actinomycetota bacterium]|nr:hypothetical protein [Actinomycetota bacterium]